MRVIVNIDVPELAPAIDFYCAALGLHLNRIIEDTAELLGTSSVIYLLQNAPDSEAVNGHSVARHYSRHWTPVHMDFVVDNIEAATHQALEAGAVRESESESECIEWRGSKCITFSDPFGHGFCLIQFDHDTYE
jgi:uncharacterized glyoxalase superfamily protein PhnB